MSSLHLSIAKSHVESAIEHNFPQNNHYVYLLMSLIALQHGAQYQQFANEALEEALKQASCLLSHSQQNYKALDTKWLALCGLALCRNQSYAEEAIKAYYEARKIIKNFSDNRGLVNRVQRLFSILLLSDSEEVLTEVNTIVSSS